jgi:hypothetical protein
LATPGQVNFYTWMRAWNDVGGDDFAHCSGCFDTCVRRCTDSGDIPPYEGCYQATTHRLPTDDTYVSSLYHGVTGFDHGGVTTCFDHTKGV